MNPLPLFPLHTVLFPRMPLQIRVFEERYLTMIHRCLASESEFGVVLIREGADVGPPAVPEGVGTTARILAAEPQEDGAIRILVEGRDRFTLLDYIEGAEQYLVGISEPLLDGPPAAEIVRVVARATAVFHKFFRMLTENAGVGLPEYDLPAEPEALSFTLSALVQTDNSTRQKYLAMTDTVVRLKAQIAALEREIKRILRVERAKATKFKPIDSARERELYSRN